MNRLPEANPFFLAVAVLALLSLGGVLLAHASEFFEREPSEPLADDGAGVVLAHVLPAIERGYEVTCSQRRDGWVRLTVLDGASADLRLEGDGSAAWWMSVRDRLDALPGAGGRHA